MEPVADTMSQSGVPWLHGTTRPVYTAIPSVPNAAPLEDSTDRRLWDLLPQSPPNRYEQGCGRFSLSGRVVVAATVLLLGVAALFWGRSSTRGIASVSVLRTPGDAVPGLWQEERPPSQLDFAAPITDISWVGCFVADDAFDLTKGPVGYGYSTVGCAPECRGFYYMALQDNGRCLCGNTYAQKPSYQRVDDSQCGFVCLGEEALSPVRFCGGDRRNAVYRLPVASNGLQDATESADTGTFLELIGVWLFGSERSRCLVTRLGVDGALSFAVPLPNGQTASGTLRSNDEWLQAELFSKANDFVGTIRMKMKSADTLVSNFMYPGETVWGAETRATRANVDVLTGSAEAGRAIPLWQISTTAYAGTTPEAEQIPQWQVTTNHGLNVRSYKDTFARVLDIKAKGTIMHGQREGNWIRLLDEPGFMMIANEASGNVFLKRAEKNSTTPPAKHVATDTIKQRTIPPQLSKQTIDAPLTYQVLTPRGLNVRSAKDSSSALLGTKPLGTTVRGWQEGVWIRLADEAGFMLMNGNDGQKFLAKATSTETTTAASSTTPSSNSAPTIVKRAPSNAATAAPTTATRTLTTTVTTAAPTTTTTMTTTSLTTITITTTTPITTTTTEAPIFPKARDASLYCYMLMMPTGYEPTLVKEQLSRAIGIFACDAYTVFSNQPITLGLWHGSAPAVDAFVIPGSLKVAYGGKWNTALNTGVFLRVWQAVVNVATFRDHHWTVKADPDSVFFPHRLRVMLRNPPMDAMPVLSQRPTACDNCRATGHEGETCRGHVKTLQNNGKQCSDALNMSMVTAPSHCGCICDASSCNEGISHAAMYLINCKFGLHGPIEVLSREAVTTFMENYHRCADIRAKPYGEDKYLDLCMQVLGVRRIIEYSLLSEIACGMIPADCGSPHVAFHPFKDVDAYLKCWKLATKND